MRSLTDSTPWLFRALLAYAIMLVGQTAGSGQPKSPVDISKMSRQDRDQLRQEIGRAKKKKRMVIALSRQLTRLAPASSTRKEKREMDDRFLLGTAELDTTTREADVRFLVKQGQDGVAEFLASYVLEAPDRTVRKWHVFARFKDDATAEQGLDYLRAQYDQAKEYRENVARIYQARTTRRT